MGIGGRGCDNINLYVCIAGYQGAIVSICTIFLSCTKSTTKARNYRISYIIYFLYQNYLHFDKLWYY